jgi:F0F1-type ATP synthase assembly protein I
MVRRPSESKGPPGLTTFQALAVASQFGITLAVSVVLGVLVGQWLDNRLGTGFVFTLIGVLLGLVASATSTVQLFRARLRKNEADWHARTTRSARDDPAADDDVDNTDG